MKNMIVNDLLKKCPRRTEVAFHLFQFTAYSTHKKKEVFQSCTVTIVQQKIGITLYNKGETHYTA